MNQRTVKATLLLDMMNKIVRIPRHTYGKMQLRPTLHPQTEDI